MMNRSQTRFFKGGGGLIAGLGILAFVILNFSWAGAERGKPPRRISGQIYDLGKVHPVYMVPGMATLIEIPTTVTGIRLGNPDAVQYFRPDKPENEVTLVLRDSHAKPTNLIIRSNRRKYVFDIIPSRQIHQDMVEVIGSYGGAAFQDSSMELIESSQSKRK
jgi:hypothetical protein